MQHRKISVLLFLLCVLFGALNLYNGRFEMRDLQVYYDAAGELLKGNSPYGTAFGLSSGFYKYSPIAAGLFAPLHTVGWMATRIIYFLILSASMSIGIPRLVHWLQKKTGQVSEHSRLVIVFAAISIAGHFSRELLLGNVNWLLLLLVLWSFQLLDTDSRKSGLALGLALLFKPHFAILLPWLMLRKQYKALGVALLSFALGLLLPALLLGWEMNTALIGDWTHAILAHNGAIGESPNTLHGMLFTIFGWQNSLLVPIVLLGAGALFFAWMLVHFQREKDKVKKRPLHMLLEYLLLLALIPNLVHTDTEHFMWTLPLIVLFFIYLGNPLRPKNIPWLLLWLAAIIPFTLTTPDIWGKSIAVWFDKSGILGFANLLLIAMALWVVRERSETIAKTTVHQ